MGEFYKRLKKAMEARHISQSELCFRTGIPKSAMSQYISGAFKPKQARTYSIAKALNVTEAWLMGYDDAPMDNDAKPESNISAVFSDHIRMIPVFESVSAGFGALAENTITGYQPVRIVSDTEAEETICIRVTGDSMYPKIEDGDIIQVRKQESVDSGDIAVVLLDGDEGLVKRVLYGHNWIELHSINPMYPVQRYEGINVQRIRVVGLVRSVIHIF